MHTERNTGLSPPAGCGHSDREGAYAGPPLLEDCISCLPKRQLRFWLRGATGVPEFSMGREDLEPVVPN